jgi:DNA repair protein RecN (Recombination protein N)
MLRSLEIRDVLIIDRLAMELGPGLNVLTGETGAGKSILLDALGFVLGWRGRAELVRAGAPQGEVTAVFDLPPGHAAEAVLAEAGIEAEGEVILRRINTVDGRKTAWVNDRRVSGEILRALSDVLVELHGQHDDRGLLNPRGHRVLLDAFAGLELGPLRQAWGAARKARQALAEAEATVAAARAEEDFLRHAVAELDALNPLPGEEATLDTRRRAMQGAERIRADVARALQMLGDDGAEQALRDAQRWLEGVVDRAGGALEAPLAALSRALIELSEAQVGVENCLSGLEVNPAELEALEERLFAIRALARKHSVTPDDLGTHAEALRSRLQALDSGAASLPRLRKAVTEAEAAYETAAQAVTVARQQAAQRLDAAMAAELVPLKMERAVFHTLISRSEAGPDGCDDVTFTVATNPGAPAGPLNRIASGGELSRFLLALKVCLTGNTPGLTMIFDEIDRGVGGATADAVGRRLKSLATSAQVLVVTHSPQVAALGAHHWRVEKRIDGEASLSTVLSLPAEARVEEIARMLSGDKVSDAARQAARALLEA